MPQYLRASADDPSDDGFSLIELLVVIIIIGILAAIAIPAFLNQRTKGYNAAVKSDLRNLATAEEAYLTDYSSYTNALASLDAAGVKTGPSNQFVIAFSGNSGYCAIGRSNNSSAYFAYDSAGGALKPTSYSTLALAVAATSCTSYTWVGTLT